LILLRWASHCASSVLLVASLASSAFAQSKVPTQRFWIWHKLRDPHKYPDPARHKEYVAGEAFLNLGQHFSLAVLPGEGAVRFVGSPW
jgi:hypothetical protein